ncbi:hypothetical protein H6G81_18690 [Scytonema hofmannii FACHB-248]|uniref:Uncharacterized protein n=1 Tax=Scytonema hofmannii FACHB-248 TaxID=1842502 RepID=A0ABR8GU81_9CYAN|nr:MULTISPECIES: hypothetical protein [Nostocales]MBD2606501.1 hypothetical protein [Scytonema hofmannii FACHB-248]
MVNVKPCVVKGLPADIREAVDNQLARGIPAPSICRWLDNQGFKVTPRQIYGYKDKTIPKAILSDPTSPIYSPDASDSQMLRSLLKTTLDVVSSLNDQYALTGDLKTAKMLREMTETASGLLKFRLTHEQPETAVTVSINIGNLEDTLEPNQGSENPYF